MSLNNREKIIKLFNETIKDVNNTKILTEEKNIFTKNHLQPLYSQLKNVPSDQKKQFGLELNELKNEIESIFKDKINQINEQEINLIKSDFDPLIPVDSLKTGALNPIQIVANDIINFFKKLSFDIFYDNEITTVDFNFDKLNIAVDHPARSVSDTFYINENYLLRVHCTSASAKVLQKLNNKDEIKSLSFGNVYRKDDDDSTHSHQFNQIDFVWVKENISVSNLKWLIDSLLKYLFSDEIQTRYRLSQFPFTEPSMEVDISCFACKSKGCNVCKKTGWIEILGSGLLHPNVLENAGIDSTKYSGIAAGFGLDRIAMLKYGINDIRHIYENDFKILKQFRGKN